MTPVKLEPTALRSQVKHSTTALLSEPNIPYEKKYTLYRCTRRSIANSTQKQRQLLRALNYLEKRTKLSTLTHVTNVTSLQYHLDESSFIGASRVTLHYIICFNENCISKNGTPCFVASHLVLFAVSYVQ